MLNKINAANVPPTTLWESIVEVTFMDSGHDHTFMGALRVEIKLNISTSQNQIKIWI
ncbi:12133_t:CDS:2 [Dentiscutata erythropus]|uniref:12133_t:CDS:1 n=1 Tax=Dentiscutata erythropus TaxID=1348616 RepID=A0A9N8YQA3_9GLOM|nr:12133_t:CDS:2 [Dentiscutata erythropus]